MNKRHLGIFILIIIIAGVFFISKNFIKKVNDNTPLTIDEPKIEENNNQPVIPEPINATKDNSTVTEAKKLPTPPSVDRPINVTASISGLEKDEAIDQIKHFSASLRNKPENMNEWIQLGNLRKIIGDYLGAVEYWKYASLLEPTFHVPYNNLGNLYQYYLNDIAKAEEYFKKMVEVSPHNEESYRNLFELYSASFKEKENLAIGVLEEGIKNVTHNENLKMMLENYKKEKGTE